MAGMREVVHVPGLDERLKALGVPLAGAVRADNLLFVSGIPPMDFATGSLVTGDVAREARLALENLRRVLEAGGSDLAHVVKTTIYCTSSDHYRTVNEVYAGFFPSDPPARTFVPCGPFDFPFDLEIECVALVKD